MRKTSITIFGIETEKKYNTKPLYKIDDNKYQSVQADNNKSRYKQIVDGINELKNNVNKLYEDIVIKEATDKFGIYNIAFVEQLSSHPEYSMYVNKHDIFHKVNVTPVYTMIPYDEAIFHELTHFIDVLDTDDDYHYSSGIIPEDVPKSIRLKNAQCWQFFYSASN